MNNELEQYLGIPNRLYKNETSYVPYIEDITYKERISTWKKQNEVFNKKLENPLENNDIYLLSCGHNNMIPQLAANCIVKKTLEKGGVPFWYNIMRNQRLEDKRLYDLIHEYQAQIDLLIIDGIYSNTNINNIDKLRSLLATFDDIPTFIIISGGFGPEVFENKVFYSYNKFIHFRDIPRRIVKDI